MEYTQTEENDIVTLKISGTIGISETQELKTALLENIEKHNKNKYVFDISSVPIISSAGLGLFVAIYKTVSKKNGFIKIKNPTKSVSRLLATTQLNNIIEVIS